MKAAASDCISMDPLLFFLFRSVFHEETASLTRCIPALMKINMWTSE